MLHFTVAEFEQWRQVARALVVANTPPGEVRWIDGRANPTSGEQGDLFARESDSPLPEQDHATQFTVPAAFLAIAKTVSFHRDPSRWALLYRMLHRIQNGERHLMNIDVDEDVCRATKMEKAVRRDAHKMKAFVRFRKVDDELGEHYIAWHRPDHYALRYTCDFFARRFDVMRWSILTPDESASWDGSELTFGPGVPRSAAPDGDELESLWKTYYAHIFNPARIKLKAMQAEMPKKHWATMPETELIGDMLRQAPSRVEKMVRYTDSIRTAEAFLPQTRSLPELRAAARNCQGCELCRDATQTVFGVGPEAASLVLVGEQPGDQEDLAGEPFVGPAGQLLDETLRDVGIDRQAVYLTNAVKHFKFTRSGKRRLHKKPSARETAACRPWLDAELTAIQPRMVVCLGATAASMVIGKNFSLTRQRGSVVDSDYADWTMATFHPSALLRASGPRSDELRALFRSDLQLVAEQLRGPQRESR
jgi:DNA polymerase